MSFAFDYWASGRGLDNITPQGKAWPEGDGFADVLVGMVGADTVLDFGCGPGRLANLFRPDRYMGVDVCPGAIGLAWNADPGRDYRLIGPDAALPVADVTLAHTVLLHVPDDDLAAMVARFTSQRIIVSEILGRRWRRGGDPPVFNRERDDYEAVFAPRYRLNSIRSVPYTRYRDTDLAIMEFVKR